MKKFIWVMLLTATVMLGTACKKSTSETDKSTKRTTTEYVESEGSPTHQSRTAMDMSEYPGDLKSNISTSHYSTHIVPKTPKYRSRNNPGALLGTVILCLIDKAFEKEEKKNHKR